MARSVATKQSSRFDKPYDWLRVVSKVEPLKVPSPSRDWIATARAAGLAMTII
jgi:hypothetical protein